MTADVHRSLPDSVARVSSALEAAGVRGTPVELTDPAPTAATAAAQLGVPVGAIANSLVFEAAGAPLLVLTSGRHRVDTGRVAVLLGGSQVRRASPDFVREHTGFAIGGVPPVGHNKPLRTLVDVALDEYDVVWAAAGHPHWVFPTAYEELVRVSGGDPARVGD